MISYDRLFELVFGVSFLVNFLIGIMVFDFLTGSKEKVRDLNSPKYLASLLIGFLGGILAETFLTSLSGFKELDQMSWFWPGLFIEVATGTAIIFTILYFLLLGSRNKGAASS